MIFSDLAEAIGVVVTAELSTVSPSPSGARKGDIFGQRREMVR